MNFADPLVYVRAVHFAATIGAAGAVFFQVLIAEPVFAATRDALPPAIERLRHRFVWLAWTGLAVAVLSGAIWLGLLAADIYDAPAAEVWRNGGVWTVSSETRFGQVLLGRLALAITLALIILTVRSAASRRHWGVIAVILAAGFLIAPAWTGHAGATPGRSGAFDLGADALHLLAAGGWVGGLLPLAMLLAAARRAKKPDWTTVTVAAVHRFSWLGIVCVGGLLASGLVNAWYDVGSLEGLTATDYGRLVVLKLCLFAAMVALASINRFGLTPRLAAAGAARVLQHNTVAEAVLGFAAVAAVGLLGAIAPASHLHHHEAYSVAVPGDAAFLHIHSDDGMAEVTLMPGHPGTARASIRLLDDHFEPLAAQNVTLTLIAPQTGGNRISRYVAAPGGDDTWQVGRITLSQPGNWTVAVGAVLGHNRRLDIAAPIVITIHSPRNSHSG